MIDKRLIGEIKGSGKYIAGNVVCQWLALVFNIRMIIAIAELLQNIGNGYGATEVRSVFLWILAAMVVRSLCAMGAADMSYRSAREVKTTLRTRIYEKLLRLGSHYREEVNTSEVVQVAVEGVDQLESYFGSYLPQFFYAMLAPLTLFAVLAPISLSSAVVLLIGVPLIPVSIALVQTYAKKLLGRYWGQYASLGDTFLENLQGLTTLKIYETDGLRQEKMNEESEKFRMVTMKVLRMQLNSITIMDLIAYGGAALGGILAVTRFQSGQVTLSGCLMILLLSADFFLPMRRLGSYFHIAMNGMAAGGKIFRLLDLQEMPSKETQCASGTIELKNVSFAYGEQDVLHEVSMTLEQGNVTAIVGASGCGKSTIAKILIAVNRPYAGSITIGDTELSTLDESSLLNQMTYIGYNSYLFKGTVRDNLKMADPKAGDVKLWKVLEQVNLATFLHSGQGLDTELVEEGRNLSGGQRQRLAMARALLHDTPIYIFDEASSNVDAQSEDDMMHGIYELAKKKTVILISHRLQNVENADRIYVLEQGRVIESGTHEDLLKEDGTYAKLYHTQHRLECYGEAL